MLLFVLLAWLLLSGRLRGPVTGGWVLMLAGVGYTWSAARNACSDSRQLQDTTHVKERIEGSVNLSFTELLVKYPIGNGLGGGGTSIPFFLQYLVKNPIGLENEFSRILLELGVPGLCLWAGFIGWTALKRPVRPRRPVAAGPPAHVVRGPGRVRHRLHRHGMLTAIPQSPLLFISIGFLVAPREEPRIAAAPLFPRRPATGEAAPHWPRPRPLRKALDEGLHGDRRFGDEGAGPGGRPGAGGSNDPAAAAEGLAADPPGRAVALSGAAVVPGLARHEGPLQADGPRRRLGGPPAAVHDDRFQP